MGDGSPPKVTEDDGRMEEDGEFIRLGLGYLRLSRMHDSRVWRIVGVLKG